VRPPTHVVLGERSSHFPHETLAAAVDLLHDGELEVMPGVGHFGPMEDPPRVAASIIAALG
jgi:pimeloyl-ACP methyl ester carboxylesterase